MKPGDTLQVLRTLMWLRWAAVVGQSSAVLIVRYGLGLPLPMAPLFGAIGALAVFNVYATRRLRNADSAPVREVLAHVGVDTAILTWLLFWSGGPTNPFVSLYLLPLVLVAAALPARAVLAVAALAVLGYSGLMLDFVPLPHAPGASDRGFDLHIVGMWINFLVTVTVVTGFVTRLALLVQRQRRELGAAREMAFRHEAILAVATQAASAAHELNTPLSTLSVILSDLRDDPSSAAVVGDDLKVMHDQVAICRDAVRRLVDNSATGTLESVTSLHDALTRILDRWQLIRPDAHANLTLDRAIAAQPLRNERALTHLLLNLMDNAADASATQGSSDIVLSVQAADDAIEFAVRDHGLGFDARIPAPSSGLRPSTKPDGLGLGLALSNMIVERFGGSLRTQHDVRGGEVIVRLPRAAMTAA